MFYTCQCSGSRKHRAPVRLHINNIIIHEKSLHPSSLAQDCHLLRTDDLFPRCRTDAVECPTEATVHTFTPTVVTISPVSLHPTVFVLVHDQFLLFNTVSLCFVTPENHVSLLFERLHQVEHREALTTKCSGLLRLVVWFWPVLSQTANCHTTSVSCPSTNDRRASGSVRPTLIFMCSTDPCDGRYQTR